MQQDPEHISFQNFERPTSSQQSTGQSVVNDKPTVSQNLSTGQLLIIP